MVVCCWGVRLRWEKGMVMSIAWVLSSSSEISDFEFRIDPTARVMSIVTLISTGNSRWGGTIFIVDGGTIFFV